MKEFKRSTACLNRVSKQVSKQKVHTLKEFRRNTVDLDRVGKEEACRVFAKVAGCKHSQLVALKDTLQGYHILFFCDIPCSVCRLAFDDPVRFARDLTRPFHTRDVLHQSKLYSPWSFVWAPKGGQGRSQTAGRCCRSLNTVLKLFAAVTQMVNRCLPVPLPFVKSWVVEQGTLP